MTMFSMAGNTPERTLSVIYATGDTATIPEAHGRFEELITLLLSGAEDEEVSELVDLMLTVTKRLEQLSERVTVRGRTVYFDGDQLRGELADALIELYEAGNPESLRPVVNFLEKAATNPSRKSVDDLYRWITKGDLIIHEDGDFLAYKGTRTGADGLRTSISQGTAFVDGEEVTGYIPNPDGAVITMPRSNVDDNEEEACSTGLHAGTANYAFGFADNETILVKINPRDVVSVPTDSSDQKLRVCRYVVQEVIESRRESRLYVQEPLPSPEVRVVDDVEAAVAESMGQPMPEGGLLFIPSDLLPYAEEDLSDDEDEDEEDYNDEGPTEDELASEEALRVLRERLAAQQETDYLYSAAEPSEAELEEVRAQAVIRDSKGRFTPESAVKAVRNSKGQFTKQS